jgi:predicted aspartyl protease
VTVPFDPTRNLVIIQGEVTGPAQTVKVDLLLDTGATDTFLDEAVLAFAGYRPSTATRQFQVLTGSGLVSVMEVPVISFSVLGQTRLNHPVLAHSFPPATGHDGVLGLDFLRGHILTIDFVKGEITFIAGGTTP